MPGISGIDFAGRIRREGNHDIGIIMLTARDDEDDLLRGLEYWRGRLREETLFDQRAYLSDSRRVEAYISTPTTSTELVTAGRITIDLEQHRVKISGEEHVDLSPTEFRLSTLF